MNPMTDKLLSGRFYLTIIVGLILLKTCWGNPEAVKEYKEVILVIIYAYFSRTDRNQQTNGGGVDEKDDSSSSNVDVSKPSAGGDSTIK